MVMGECKEGRDHVWFPTGQKRSKITKEYYKWLGTAKGSDRFYGPKYEILMEFVCPNCEQLKYVSLGPEQRTQSEEREETCVPHWEYIKSYSEPLRSTGMGGSTIYETYSIYECSNKGKYSGCSSCSGTKEIATGTEDIADP